ncbi:hypothetical protein [Pseudomonas syringae group genomosp. 7]|uniref:hypothetical protein n=1 Tax=Pseudomonas syringae group genomosp. 7 TaxID=251699 RepID=UPI00376F4D0A
MMGLFVMVVGVGVLGLDGRIVVVGLRVGGVVVVVGVWVGVVGGFVLWLFGVGGWLWGGLWGCGVVCLVCWFVLVVLGLGGVGWGFVVVCLVGLLGWLMGGVVFWCGLFLGGGVFVGCCGVVFAVV